MSHVEVEEMLSFYERRAEETAGRKNAGPVEGMLSIYERRAEDSVDGGKNDESSEQCCLLMRGGRRTVQLKGRMLNQV